MRLRSKIYTGEVSHARLEPVHHAFRYPLYFYAFNLSELHALDERLPLFAYNRRSVTSLHDEDYLGRQAGSILEKAMSLLREKGCEQDIASIDLVTSGRYFNRGFNPVSFYLCRNKQGALRALIADVNNTFGEKHVYVLDQPILSDSGSVRFEHEKEFHVSPFNDMEGAYRFYVKEGPDGLDIRVNMHKEGRAVFTSRLRGEGRPLTARTLAKTLLRYPFTLFMTMPRILVQAAQLKFRKKLTFHTKPEPSSEKTLRMKPPSLFERVCMRLVDRYLSTLRAGKLLLVHPDGREVAYGNLNTMRAHKVRITSYGFFKRLVLHGDVGFAESFMAGEWSCDDLTAVLSLFANNIATANRKPSLISRLGHAFNFALHAVRKNTRTGSRRNISAHYDLSNDFYKLFLDRSMMYSCALYEQGDETLEEAQIKKLDRLIDKAQLQRGDHVLEIGTGWGGFAIRAAQRTGCHVTTITLSQEQIHLAKERVRDAGLESFIDVQLCDYRDMKGSFDKIVSIEMLEAVGHAYFGTFFSALERLLKPDGLAVVQVITIPDQRYETYRRGCDFIQKHIFPGGMLPSLTALSQAATQHSQLHIESLDNIGTHYATTLKAWRERFIDNLDRVRDLGFDDVFVRKWLYYLCYCEAGFATRQTNTLHLTLSRANSKRREPIRKGLTAEDYDACNPDGARHGRETPVL